MQEKRHHGCLLRKQMLGISTPPDTAATERSGFARLKFWKHPRINAATEWVGNVALRYVTSYGERPVRAIWTAVATILGGALLLGLFDTDASLQKDWPGPDIEILDAVLSYLLASLQAFTSFLFGTPGVDNPVIGIIAQLEALMGTLLVAVLVFTLTRAVHR